jgi:hypothetical protein
MGLTPLLLNATLVVAFLSVWVSVLVAVLRPEADGPAARGRALRPRSALGGANDSNGPRWLSNASQAPAAGFGRGLVLTPQGPVEANTTFSDILRMQRYLSWNNSYTLNPSSAGVQMETAFFNKNYSSARMNELSDFFKADVLGRAIVDVYWNNITTTWQLCPIRSAAAEQGYAACWKNDSCSAVTPTTAPAAAAATREPGELPPSNAATFLVDGYLCNNGRYPQFPSKKKTKGMHGY